MWPGVYPIYGDYASQSKNNLMFHGKPQVILFRRVHYKNAVVNLLTSQEYTSINIVL